MKGETVKLQNHDRELLQAAERVFSRALVQSLGAEGHDFLEGRREGSSVYDSQGQRCLDGSSSAGTFNLGRRHPVLVTAFQRALDETDQGNFVMPSEEKTLLARRLAAFMPGDLECVLYGVTRGESLDAACKLARGFTGRGGIVTVDGGCYGETGFALSLSEKVGKEQFGKLIPGVTVVPFGDLEAARVAIGQRTAAFVLEPIQAENHCREAARDYLSGVRALCDRQGAKLIFDETQSGFGRSGVRFFCEQLGVIPDILVVGEALTGGMFPMTAMVFTPELKGFFDAHPLIHLCTFGGHDLGCRVAMAALEVYENVQPWERAAFLGQRFFGELERLNTANPGFVTSVSGRGLLLSFLCPSEDLAARFCAQARRNGLLLERGRVDGRSVLLRPSLLLSDEEADAVMEVLERTAAALRGALG